jgi:hypothetical protein
MCCVVWLATCVQYGALMQLVSWMRTDKCSREDKSPETGEANLLPRPVTIHQLHALETWDLVGFYTVRSVLGFRC